jgi:hypothetical protein
VADHFDTGLEISPCLRMLFACRAMTNARSARFDFSQSSVERGIRSAWYAGHRLERTALGVDRETMSGVLPDIPHRTAEQVRQPPNRPPCSAMTVTSTSVLPHSRRRGAFTIVQKVSSHTTDSAMPCRRSRAKTLAAARRIHRRKGITFPLSRNACIPSSATVRSNSA